MGALMDLEGVFAFPHSKNGGEGVAQLVSETSQLRPTQL
jgi:hypothetical protein